MDARRTLYCASQAEGAIGEKLADFAQSTSAAVRVEAYMDDDADPEHIDDQLLRPLRASGSRYATTAANSRSSSPSSTR